MRGSLPFSWTSHPPTQHQKMPLSAPNRPSSHGGGRRFESGLAHCCKWCFEEIAGSAEFVDPDHGLSTFNDKLSTPSESGTDNECSSPPFPAYANNPSSSHYTGETLSDFTLPFTVDELSCYVDSRSLGLADKSCDWIRRSAEVFSRATLGVISRQTIERLRTEALEHYARGATVRRLLLRSRFLSI
jgi:hypothetical protein